jgi:hypothetical protein
MKTVQRTSRILGLAFLLQFVSSFVNGAVVHPAPDRQWLVLDSLVDPDRLWTPSGGASREGLSSREKMGDPVLPINGFVMR